MEALAAVLAPDVEHGACWGETLLEQAASRDARLGAPVSHSRNSSPLGTRRLPQTQSSARDKSIITPEEALRHDHLLHGETCGSRIGP